MNRGRTGWRSLSNASFLPFKIGKMPRTMKCRFLKLSKSELQTYFKILSPQSVQWLAKAIFDRNSWHFPWLTDWPQASGSSCWFLQGVLVLLSSWSSLYFCFPTSSSVLLISSVLCVCFVYLCVQVWSPRVLRGQKGWLCFLCSLETGFLPKFRAMLAASKPPSSCLYPDPALGL